MIKNLLHSLLRFLNARTSDIHAPRIPLVGTLIVVVFSSSLLTAKDQLPPASAFDMTEMKNSSTLDLKILKNELVPVATESGEKVRCSHLEFFSQNWGGEDIRHLAKVYLPTNGIVESKRGMALINQGGSSNMAEGFDFEQEYGAITAAKLGIPSMLLQSNIPGDHWGVKGGGPIRRYTAAKFFENGDPNWIHWIALAKVYMRAMTVLSTLDEVQAKQFVLTGSSKRAQSIWIAAAVDDRIRGIVSIARPGNFPNLLLEHNPAPGALPDRNAIRTTHEGSKHDYMVHLEDMYTTRGYEYMAYIDPYQFLSRVKVPVMYIIGTNDNIFNSFDDHGFYPFYQGDKSFAYVPNYRHGMSTTTHAEAARAWAAHCFWGRPVTTITALESIDHGELNISAIVKSQADVTSVRLYYCFLQGKEFNDAKDSYQSVPMKRERDSVLWNAPLPTSETASGEVYWYVETRDQANGLESIATSLLKRSSITLN
jgi:PhoPQ-activated pathogenicity-related protein